MLAAGIVVLVLSVIVERAATIRSRHLVDAVGGDWQAKEFRYAGQGGAPKWLSAVALLSYVGALVGIVLIVVGIV